MSTTQTARARALLDATLSWVSLGYGFYATAIEPVVKQDDVQIALGIEAIVLALTGFLWAGSRRSLGAALIIVGLAAPAVGYATAPLYWDEVELLGEAFWTMVGVGAAVGLPLIALGAYTLLRARRAAPRPDPWWFTPLRWILQAGLIMMVLAFRSGGWDDGVPLVYAGAGIALVALLVALPRRIAVTSRGIGLLLLFLGLAALAVIGVAAAFVGANMSGEEAAVGLLPAALVAFVGLVLVRAGGSRRAVGTPRDAPGPIEVSTDGLDATVLDLTPPLRSDG